MSAVKNLNELFSQIFYPSIHRRVYQDTERLSLRLTLREDQKDVSLVAYDIDIKSTGILSGITLIARDKRTRQVLRSERLVKSDFKDLTYRCVFHSLPAGIECVFSALYIRFSVRLQSQDVVPEASLIGAHEALAKLLDTDPIAYKHLVRLCTETGFQLDAGTRRTMLIDSDLLQQDGTVHPFVRMIVQNAFVNEDGVSIRLGQPLAGTRDKTYRIRKSDQLS